MGGREQDDHEGHHGAVEDHEEDLVVGQRAVEAAAELGDAEGATDQDTQGGDGHGFWSLHVSILQRLFGSSWGRKGRYACVRRGLRGEVLTKEENAKRLGAPQLVRVHIPSAGVYPYTDGKEGAYTYEGES